MEEKLKLSAKQLQDAAAEHLANLDNEFASVETKASAATLAQFYLVELDRRDSAWIARRDFVMEAVVIVLISVELVFSYVGWREGKNQQKVFDQLNTSSAETARTLTAVRVAQEASLETQKHTLENLVAMNSALQDEMDLNFTEALRYSGGMSGGGQERVDFLNNGRATVFFWGSKFDGQPPKMQQKATVLTPGKSVSFDISDLVKKFVEIRRGSTVTLIPFELYFTRENGTKYVSKGDLQLNANNSVWIDRTISTRKQW